MPSDTNKFNFGKGRVVFGRAKDYLQSLQFAMTIAMTIKLYEIPAVWMIAWIVACIIAVALFMRFDVKRNMPAEYNWTWQINPAYQELLNEIKTLKNELSRLRKSP